MQSADFDPIDVAESKVLGFDFAPLLRANDTIASVVSVTCALHRGTDADPSSHAIGSPTIVPSDSTQAANSGVAQMFGGMLDGVGYTLTCVVQTAGGEVLDIWARIPCRSPS
jgi:hypothetical protein